MRSVTDCLHNAGGLTEYTCKNGKILKIKFLDLKAMSQYENKLQNKAIKLLTEQKSIIDNTLFTEMFKELLDRITAGHYAFGSDLCNKSLKTVNGITGLLSILCEITPEEATDLIIQEGDSLTLLFNHVLNKSFSSPDDEDATIDLPDGQKKS